MRTCVLTYGRGTHGLIYVYSRVNRTALAGSHNVMYGTVIVGLRENRDLEGTHRFYRFRTPVRRPHAPFLLGGAVSIHQM
jgi:hypothetical protein